MKSTDGRSRCQGEAAETGSANGFHKYVDPTTTSGRRGRRMCNSTIGMARARSPSAAGLVKLTAVPEDPERNTYRYGTQTARGPAARPGDPERKTHTFCG
jgi:hypothetical protein